MGSVAKKLLPFLGIFLATWLSVRYLLPLFFPFLLGTALALCAEPMAGFLSERLRLPRFAAAGLGVSIAFCFLGLLVLLVAALMIREVRYLAGVLPDLEETARSGIRFLENRLLDLADGAPRSIGAALQQNIREFFSGGTALLNRAMRYLLGFAGGLLTHVPEGALTLGTAVISGFMISAKLPALRGWFRQHLPREKLRPILAAGKRMRLAVGGWLLAQLKLAGVTFLLLAAGLLLLRIPYALLWAGAVCLLDALPVLGTGTVLLPWSFVCFLQGHAPRAIGLLGLYASITLIRSTLEPKLVGKQLGLDPLVTLIALYTGYKLWGFGGMILSPMVAVTAVQLLPGQKEKP